MANATNKEQFRQKVLRRLGYPVIGIEVTDEHVEDCLDYALALYTDYHFDATEKVYYKYLIEDKTFPDAIHHIDVKCGGTGYQNTDTVVFSSGNATAHIITNADGCIVQAIPDLNGKAYAIAPTVTVQSNTGSNAQLEAVLGGFIEMPENVVGVLGIFDLSAALQASNIFSVQYQFVLNDLYTFSSTYSMIPYYITMQYINMVTQLLNGEQPIRYNRKNNRMYLDMNWDRVKSGEYLVIEANQVINPDEAPKMWNDYWLIEYAAMRLKLIWGEILSKHKNMQMPGGTQYNADEIREEAQERLDKLEEQLFERYRLPAGFFLG